MTAPSEGGAAEVRRELVGTRGMMADMNQQTHQDHAEHAQAAFADASDVTDPIERNEMLSVAGYHAAMASYRLSQEISAQLAASA